jgi:hypothetical protein
MTDMNRVAQALNAVASVGQERAALAAAAAELARGQGLTENLSTWSSPTPDEASANLAVWQAAIAGDTANATGADADPVDPVAWAAVRQDITRSYVEVAGVEGVSGALASIDVAGILWDAITAAPKAFLDGAKQAVAGIAGGAADIVQNALAAIVQNLWFWLLAIGVGLYLLSTGKLKVPLIPVV